MYVTISFTHLGFGTRPLYHLKIVLEQSTKNTTRQKYIYNPKNKMFHRPVSYSRQSPV